MDLSRLPRTIELTQTATGVEAVIIDQRRLPESLESIAIRSWRAMRDAIGDLAIRGAPAIGVAGASALVLYVCNEARAGEEGFLANLREVSEEVAHARPTAVNLPHATKELYRYAEELCESGTPSESIGPALYARVKRMEAEDEAANREIGRQGASLVRPGSRILTHCNAGSLATVFFGTALGVVYTAASEGKVERVYVDETRPVGQGARLSAWELSQVGIPTTLLCDNMAASLMATGSIDAVFVGADRVCRNGDVVNKIGTYGLAVLARYHRIPFYVCAPSTTLDFELPHGGCVDIEQRSRAEVTCDALSGVEVINPAFDVTPASLVDSIITDRGISKPQELAAVYGLQ